MSTAIPRKLTAFTACVAMVLAMGILAVLPHRALADEGHLVAGKPTLETQAVTSIDYRLGEQYSAEFNYAKFLKFTLSETSHVYAVSESSAWHSDLAFFNMLEQCIYDGTNATKTQNEAEAVHITKLSCNLEPGDYYLRVDQGGWTQLSTVLMTAEPVVSLGRTSITSLTSASPSSFTVKTTDVADALSYEYEYSTSSDFSNSTVREHPVTSFTATGLRGDAYFYVRVRPFTVYNDGLKVFGDWSRAKAVYVQGLKNSVTIAAGKKTFKYKALKKADKSFLVEADDKIGAKLTFSRASVTAAAKKYLKVNNSTGVVTVKKGLKRGNYKLGVKVTAAATGAYGAAFATKVLAICVK